MFKTLKITGLTIALAFSANSAIAAISAEEFSTQVLQALANGETLQSVVDQALLDNPESADLIIEQAVSEAGTDIEQIKSIMKSAKEKGVESSVIAKAAIKGAPSFSNEIINEAIANDDSEGASLAILTAAAQTGVVDNDELTALALTNNLDTDAVNAITQEFAGAGGNQTVPEIPVEQPVQPAPAPAPAPVVVQNVQPPVTNAPTPVRPRPSNSNFGSNSNTGANTASPN
ncbi:hypothetical protein [Marinicellulosiphila megalodicopiae]|uniref:hypothetical protein n=1 Tax=Marinicellulosiphila megalodicopiae TaxID=2724896 RepID=UPI003BB145DA